MKRFDIETLKAKYKNHSFFELKRLPQDEHMPTLANIEDFFELTSQIGYLEEQLDEEDETQEFEHNMINVFIDDIEFSKRQAFYNYYKSRKESKSLCHLGPHTTLTLIGLNKNIEYYYDGGQAQDKEKLFLKVMSVLDQIYADFCKEQEQNQLLQKEQEKQLEKDILNCISNYKKAYLEATSLREKERIVTKAQLDLKATYGVTSSSDYRANKEFIRSQFED